MTITLTDEQWDLLCYTLGYAESQLKEHESVTQARQVENLFHALQANLTHENQKSEES